MSLRKLTLSSLFLGMLFINSPIQCMQASDLEEEQDTYSFECLPNELLLLIFYYKIQNIINTNEPAQAVEKFEALLNLRCLAKQRFDGFKDDLKKYFVAHKKIEINHLEFMNTPYKFGFKIDGRQYLTQVGDKLVQERFAEELSKLDLVILKKLGKKIVKTIMSNEDKNYHRLGFQRLFAQIIYNPYFLAKKANKSYMPQALANIIELVKPIFKAFPEKHDTMYTNNLEKYALTEEDIILFQINTDTEN